MKKIFSFLIGTLVFSYALAEMTTSGSGVTYTFDSLCSIDTSGVSKVDGAYVVSQNLTIAYGDTLSLQNNDTVKIGDGVIIYFEGYADFAPSDTAYITTDSEDSTPKGLRFKGDYGSINIENVTMDYCGIYFGASEGSLTARNCTFRYYNTKISSAGAINFAVTSHGHVIENCSFIESGTAAIASGSNTPPGLVVKNCYFYHNNTKNSNRPQINVTCAGSYDIEILNNTIIGGQYTKVGGIAVTNLLGLSHTCKAIIQGNYVCDNRYGFTTNGSVETYIINNSFVNNCYETTAANGGSGISISANKAGTYIEGNYIEGNLWGVTLLTTTVDVNMGKTSDPTAEDYNPGGNVFVNNGNDSTLYDLYNNTANEVYAQGNTWNVESQDSASIESVIVHIVDDETLGRVYFMPAAESVAADYTITTAAEWNALAELMATDSLDLTGNVVLIANDIDFTGDAIKPLGYDRISVFNGELDGNGKTISGISATADESIYGGLIVTAGPDSYIHDITTKGTLTSSYTYSGGIIGCLYGKAENITNEVTCSFSARYSGGITGMSDSLSTVSACVNNASITSTAYYTGGISGYSYYAAICNCTNEGSISSSSYYAGGIVGYTSTGSLVTGSVNNADVSAKGYSGGAFGCIHAADVKESVNNGDVTGTYYYIGGFVGSAHTDSYINGCTNNGAVSSSSQHSGGFVGSAYCTTIDSCYNKGDVTSTGYNTGGFCGYSYQSTFKNCLNEGDVTSSAIYPAGFTANNVAGCSYEDCGNKGNVTFTGTTLSCYAAGFIGNCYYGTFTGCYNEGTVYAEAESSRYVAGLVAYMSSSQANYTFIDCWNSGDISGGNNVAGLVAVTRASSFTYMEGCYNTGNITSRSSSTGSYYTAGLIAKFPYGSTIRNCWNSGNITSNADNYTAGLIGYRASNPTATYPLRIVQCYNTGNVTSAGYVTGGIIAHLTKNTTVDSCYNGGFVTGSSYYVGGIAGQFDGYKLSSITNCYNTGEISAGDNSAGGIVGYCKYQDEITNCFNTGDVTAPAFAGGIAGQSGANYTNIYSSGNISGGNYVGGLVGSTIADSTTIVSGYFSGNIITTADTTVCGNILGAGTDDATYWGEGNSMSGTYYLSANAVECTDTVSVGLSYAELAKLDLGDDWTAGDNYTYPRLTTLADNDYAKAYAAAVVPADGDSYSSITTDFNVGTPDGVTWTASPDVVAFDGNAATFTETVDGTVTLTATCGDVSVTTEITCDVEVEGINDVMENTLEVVEERFYNLAGAQVAEPEDDARAIYIVVKTYSDGTTETVKEVR